MKLGGFASKQFRFNELMEMGRKRKTEEVQGADEVEVDVEVAGDLEPVHDEILRKPGAGTNSQKKEKWKYKTRKKRKKLDHEDLQNGVIKALGGSADKYVPLSVLRVQRKSKGEEEGGSRDEGSSRTSREEESSRTSREEESTGTSRGSREESSVENSVDFDLKAVKRKYQKMSVKTRNTPYGRKIFNQISGTLKKLDSGGNSENQSSSEDIKKRRASWRDQTTECDVCGKEMLKTRLKKHLRIAHKSQKLYPCDECSYNAPNITELKVHLRKKHKLSIATVLKMVKFMKANKKHRRSIIDDEDEVPRPMNKRLVGLNSTINDELHQTGSEAENKHIKYITSVGVAEDFGTNSKDVSEDDIEEDVAEREHKTEEIKDEFKDSGLESQPTSQDEEEASMSADEMLAKTRKLSSEDLPAPGAHQHSLAQVTIMRAYFAKEPRPSKEQEKAMSETLSMDFMKIRWWFQKERKKVEDARNRLNIDVNNDDVGLFEERKTRERKPETTKRGLRMAAPSLGSQMFLEYTEEDILLSETPFDDIVEGGGPVCLGVDINAQNNRCLLCNWSCSFRGNLYKHLRVHGFEPKCCTLTRSQSNLAPETKGCRKTFTQETFNLHTCDNDAPVHFRGLPSKYVQPIQTSVGGGGTASRNSGWDSSDDEDTEDNGSLAAVISQLKGNGEGVCLGYVESETLSQCSLCDYNTKSSSNLYTHIKRHWDREIKFCCGPRESSTLKESGRGCRKVFLAQTFDGHTCTDEIPKPLGSFPLKGPGGNANKKKGPKKAQIGSGFRGYEKNFGVPDGSPAKFYSDRYRRVFSQLGVKDTSTMGSLLKWQLDYLTSGQMEAVRDYVEEPGERFFLVRLSTGRFSKPCWKLMYLLGVFTFQQGYKHGKIVLGSVLYLNWCPVETVFSTFPDARVSDCQLTGEKRNAPFCPTCTCQRQKRHFFGKKACVGLRHAVGCKWCVDEEAVETEGSIGLEGGASYAVVS